MIRLLLLSLLSSQICPMQTTTQVIDRDIEHGHEHIEIVTRTPTTTPRQSQEIERPARDEAQQECLDQKRKIIAAVGTASTLIITTGTALLIKYLGGTPAQPPH